jgi:cyclic pyranopterin monophosphate synthase
MKLTHTDQDGKAHMVDVGDKPMQQRTAEAGGFIAVKSATLRLIRDNGLKKGDVLTVAEIAGIQAAKRTSELIPLCHPLQLSKVSVETQLVDDPGRSGVKVHAMARCLGQTGVEMEALTAVSVALLTIYDMCKAVDKEMVIENIYLIEKKKV